MKKIYSFIIVLLAIVSMQANAQQSCNAAFTTQSINASTVKFNPAITDSPSVYHTWNFNEISGSYYNYSNAVSPTNTFPTGTFSIGHRTYRTNPNGTSVCSDSSNQVITITQGACLLSANFYTYPSQTNYLEHYYYNYTNYLSTSDSIRWTFGDGTSSNVYNPTHIYANNGIYNVCLRVIKRNPAGLLTNCVSEICKLDTVAYQCNLNAYFQTNTDTATAPATIQFYNYSYGYAILDSITWNFGDGSPVSHVDNPNHIYTTAGTYTACLRIKKNNVPAGIAPCVREFCKQIVINGPSSCNLLANFTYYRDSIVTVPNTYHFTNTTLPLASTDSIRWTFGDGTSSNQVNPNHAYTTTGTYNVCLRVIKRNANGVLTNCISEKCYVVVVAPPIIPCNMQANFSNLTDSLQSNLIHFTNTTIGYASGDSITWTFGDGTSSNQINPNHVYTTAGTYIVCIRVKKPTTVAGATACIREFCKTIVVTVPCTLVANFYSYRDSVTTIPNAYHFINTSAPLASTDSIRWTFGDGTSSSQIDPLHFYANQGNYTVCLRVIKRNAAGLLTNCVSEKCYTINVVQLCNINAAYTWQADSANYKKINFRNFTVPLAVATALWNFGDGTTATTWNASHTYAQAGRYYVCLRIQYGACISYKCDSITIVAPVAPPTCEQLSLFSTATTNNTVSFAPNFLQPNVQYTWTFGDGTGSQWTNVSHQYYLGAGVYTACLTAFKDINCASTTCKTITIPSTTNCNNITLSINDTRDSLVPNRVTFTAISNTATTTQQWTITRIPTTAGTGTTTINTNNPTYMFLDSGYYNVCVKATYANGCIKTICKTIHIVQPMPGVNTCTLQVYPNPASTLINASVTLVQPAIINASVYNNMAVLVAQNQQQGVVGNNIVSVNIATLPSGVYTLRVTYGNQICYATFVK
jgi:PKD repeat protein